jgi:mono/diheme cytochrome c family protein
VERKWWTLIAVSIAIFMLLLDSTAGSDSTRLVAAQSRVPVTGEPITIHVEPPPDVKRAGGKRLAEFKLGRTVTAQSGCLACHRIGAQGNRGPGPSLTYVGSRLSARQIEHAILHAREPMPSFTGLPKRKLGAMVEFLSLLRRPRKGS